MGKSKKSKSKKKGGTKKTTSSSKPSSVAGGADDELCEQFSNLNSNDVGDDDESTVSLSPSERYAKGLELIAGRDEMERMLTDEANAKELSEKEDLGHLSYLIMAMQTVNIAECGIYEEEKHMSLVYAEEHSDTMFADGGMQHLFDKLSRARMNAVMEDPSRKAELKRLKEVGDTEGSLRLMKEIGQVIEDEENSIRARAGMPPITQDDPFIGTLIDDELFSLPPPGQECDICFLILPNDDRCTYQPCCGKTLCDGCMFFHRESCKEYSCPFCRKPVSTTDEERIKLTKKRLLVNDSMAYHMMGGHHLMGSMGLKKDVRKALECIEKAAELGLNAAHHTLGSIYSGGMGVEKDAAKALHYYRLAAIGGNVNSRHALGVKAYFGEPPQVELALKHWLSAEAGHDESLKNVKLGYQMIPEDQKGFITKDVFAKTLRTHQSATDQIKSDQRDKAMKYYQKNASERASQRGAEWDNSKGGYYIRF